MPKNQDLNYNMKKLILNALNDSIVVQNSLLGEVAKIVLSVETIVKAFTAGNKLLVVGNGGAAADAQHFVAEFVATYKMKRPGLPAICLNENISIITAWTNDFGFESLYERQVQALGKPGDVFIAFSTGGGSLEPGLSSNIALAAKKAKKMGLKIIGFSGKSGGALKDIADPCIVIKSQVTARIQEAHMTLAHIITEMVDEIMFGDEMEKRKNA